MGRIPWPNNTTSIQSGVLRSHKVTADAEGALFDPDEGHQPVWESAFNVDEIFTTLCCGHNGSQAVGG